MTDQARQDDVHMSLVKVRDLARQVFRANDVADNGAEVLADVIVKAERDGPSSHGLAMLPNYVSSLRSGWVDGQAAYRVSAPAPGVIAVDGNNGFSQVIIAECAERLAEAAASQGVAVLSIRDAHHIGALRGDVEPLAERGLVAIAMSSSRPWVVPWQGEDPLFGTNPMAFACPAEGRAPIVWDQASSAIAVTDIRLAAEAGETLREEAGLDTAGQPTSDASEIIKTARLLPFGRHKGSSIALMVEIMAAALTGGAFAIEDRSAEVPGAASSRGGQMIIALDPEKLYGSGFPARLEPLVTAIASNGQARIPGDGRLERRARAIAEGISIKRGLYDRLQALLLDRDGVVEA